MQIRDRFYGGAFQEGLRQGMFSIGCHKLELKAFVEVYSEMRFIA